MSSRIQTIMEILNRTPRGQYFHGATTGRRQRRDGGQWDTVERINLSGESCNLEREILSKKLNFNEIMGTLRIERTQYELAVVGLKGIMLFIQGREDVLGGFEIADLQESLEEILELLGYKLIEKTEPGMVENLILFTVNSNPPIIEHKLTELPILRAKVNVIFEVASKMRRQLEKKIYDLESFEQEHVKK